MVMMVLVNVVHDDVAAGAFARAPASERCHVHSDEVVERCGDMAILIGEWLSIIRSRSNRKAGVRIHADDKIRYHTPGLTIPMRVTMKRAKQY